MPRLLIIIAGTIVLASLLGGCASDPSRWHTRIKPVPAAHPHGAVDQETGQSAWHDYAEEEFELPLSREDAFRILLSTETFADAYVGYAGTKSTQVDAFQVLLKQPDAVVVFEDLLHRGQTAGQLYALCGLRLLAPDQYSQAESRFLQSDQTVPSQQGCVGGGREVRELVRCSNPNTVRLRPGETIKQWFARVKPPKDAAMYDISGGATPEAFRDAN